MRQIVSLLQDVQDAIEARRPGWRALEALTEDEPMRQTQGKLAVRHIADAQRTELQNSRGYLIRIAKRKDQERAMGVLLAVPAPYHSGAEDEFLVMGVHIKALQEAGINFKDITKRPLIDG